VKQFAVALSAILAIFIATGCVATAQEPKVGGPCKYDKYPGKATITKIEKTDTSIKQATLNASAGYEGFEIWYTFIPNKPLPAGPWNEIIREPKLFQLSSSLYPGEKYIKKYNVKVGKVFATTLSIIKSGTCTPNIYDLHGLDINDLFERKAGK
jgi:hypothetical protein